MSKTKYNEKLSGLYGWFCYHTQFWLKPSHRITYSEMMWNFYHNAKLMTCIILLAGGYATAKFTSFKISDAIEVFIAALLAHLFWNFHKNRKRRKNNGKNSKML